MSEWQKGLPQEPGYYWVSGMFFDNSDYQSLRDTCLIHVTRDRVFLDGSSIYKNDVKDPYFMPAQIPEFKEEE